MAASVLRTDGRFDAEPGLHGRFLHTSSTTKPSTWREQIISCRRCLCSFWDGKSIWTSVARIRFCYHWSHYFGFKTKSKITLIVGSFFFLPTFPIRTPYVFRTTEIVCDRFRTDIYFRLYFYHCKPVSIQPRFVSQYGSHEQRTGGWEDTLEYGRARNRIKFDPPIFINVNMLSANSNVDVMFAFN